MDRAYINYDKFEELTDRGVVYVTKMKKNLNYEHLWTACIRIRRTYGISGAGRGVPQG